MHRCSGPGLPAVAYAVINDGVGGGQLQVEPVDFLLAIRSRRNSLGQEAPDLVSVRPRHGVRSPISGAGSRFVRDGGDCSVRPLCGGILRADR